MSGRHRLRGLPIKRDAITWLFGLGGLGWMIYTGHAPWPLVIVCGLMGGTPGLSQLLVQLRTTAGSDMSSPESSSPPSPSISSSTS